ncbi:hypothetical protein PR048_025646 [Dryococelus australis]|uniref:Uncharacterized protein n=1 Tax=Dryococelus australis TaxID=614101 RepID=A0ABQ9GRV1_9NEOP|nr:hypothetical protein PR048_025646 [Dryococelus australis]
MVMCMLGSRLLVQTGRWTALTAHNFSNIIPTPSFVSMGSLANLKCWCHIVGCRMLNLRMRPLSCAVHYLKGILRYPATSVLSAMFIHGFSTPSSPALLECRFYKGKQEECYSLCQLDGIDSITSHSFSIFCIRLCHADLLADAVIARVAVDIGILVPGLSSAPSTLHVWPTDCDRTWYGKDPPARSTKQERGHKFMETGSVLHQKGAEDIDQVRAAYVCRPGKSV